MRTKSALIIIDLFSLLDFPESRSLGPAVVRAAHQAALLVAAFDERDLPVIVANDNFGDWKRDFPNLVEVSPAWRACRRHCRTLGAVAAALLHLTPKHSAFLATPLPVLLANKPIHVNMRRSSHGRRPLPCQIDRGRRCRCCSAAVPQRCWACARPLHCLMHRPREHLARIRPDEAPPPRSGGPWQPRGCPHGRHV